MSSRLSFRASRQRQDCLAHRRALRSLAVALLYLYPHTTLTHSSALHCSADTRLRLQIYTEKGFSPAEAHTVMAAMTRKPEYADYFVDHMMVQELGVSCAARLASSVCKRRRASEGCACASCAVRPAASPRTLSTPHDASSALAQLSTHLFHLSRCLLPRCRRWCPAPTSSRGRTGWSPSPPS